MHISYRTDPRRFFNMLNKIASNITPVANARLAACLVYKGDIISIGFNRRKSHPFQRKYGTTQEAIYFHAEIDAIHEAKKILTPEGMSKSSLFVSRMKWFDSNKRKMIPGMACPCEGCKKAISEYKISKVYYSLDNEGFETL